MNTRKMILIPVEKYRHLKQCETEQHTSAVKISPENTVGPQQQRTEFSPTVPAPAPPPPLNKPIGHEVKPQTPPANQSVEQVVHKVTWSRPRKQLKWIKL